MCSVLRWAFLIFITILSRFTSDIFPTKKWWGWASWQGNTRTHRTLPPQMLLCVSGVAAGWLRSSVSSPHWPVGLSQSPVAIIYSPHQAPWQSELYPLSKTMRKSLQTCGNDHYYHSRSVCLLLPPFPKISHHLWTYEPRITVKESMSFFSLLLLHDTIRVLHCESFTDDVQLDGRSRGRESGTV